MPPTIINPYSRSPLPWLRGNLHTHTANSDGPGTPREIVRAYAERGYDFLMLSDHDFATDVSVIDARGMVLIPGNEVTANGPHMLHVGAREAVEPSPDRQAVLDAIAANGGFAVMCHPNWERDFNHCSQEDLERLKGYAGIEIFNTVVSWLRGNANATDRWDRLLGSGRRTWGFANDDCHKESDIGFAWNVVQSAQRDASSIVDAMRDGRFYASTGVEIETINVDTTTIAIRTRNAQRIAAYSDYGFRRDLVDQREIAFTVPDAPEYTYVRFECWGRPGEKAWTQPFFLETHPE